MKFYWYLIHFFCFLHLPSLLFNTVQAGKWSSSSKWSKWSSWSDSEDSSDSCSCTSSWGSYSYKYIEKCETRTSESNCDSKRYNWGCYWTCDDQPTGYPTDKPTPRPTSYPTLAPVDTNSTLCYCSASSTQQASRYYWYWTWLCGRLPYNKEEKCDQFSCDYICERGTEEPTPAPTPPTAMPTTKPTEQPSGIPTFEPSPSPTPAPTLQTPIECTDRYQCENDRLQCKGNPCKITCSGKQSCVNAKIDCQGSCEIYCTGKKSCQGAQVTVFSPTSFNQYELSLLECQGKKSCEHMNIKMSNSTLETWHCNNVKACSNATVESYHCSHVNLQCFDQNEACNSVVGKCTGKNTVCRFDNSEAVSSDLQMFCDSDAQCKCDNTDTSTCTINTGNVPTVDPTIAPTLRPSAVGETTAEPTKKPSHSPTPSPTLPTPEPTLDPTFRPTDHPTDKPTAQPTESPTKAPTDNPSDQPTKSPTDKPTDHPSPNPTSGPSMNPTDDPTPGPSPSPTRSPSANPTPSPSDAPTEQPSAAPSAAPSVPPTPNPVQNPTRVPSDAPTVAPSSPTAPPTKRNTLEPSPAPSDAPTSSPTPPTQAPSTAPSQTPSLAPSDTPTDAPSTAPSDSPSYSPSIAPSTTPSIAPTLNPSVSPTSAPSKAPVANPSSAPSGTPTEPPSMAPSQNPTSFPSGAPSISPSIAPSDTPSFQPSSAPTESPSATPTHSPVQPPTGAPSDSPTGAPTHPTGAPTIGPSLAPSDAPTVVPTPEPTSRKAGWRIGCDEPNECENSVIVCPHDICLVECTNYRSCRNTELQCFPEAGCIFHCTGDEACVGATIHLQSNSLSPYLQCSGNDSCADLTVIADANAQMELLECSHNSSCTNLHMSCKAGNATCVATCLKDNSCSGLTSRCTEYGTRCSINSTNATHDVTPRLIYDPRVDYHHCDNCIEEEKVPTQSPTQAPTSQPTQTPTDEPSDAPTDAPSPAPTFSPTKAPTRRPTKYPLPGGQTYEPSPAPSSAPTVYIPTPKPTSTADVCLLSNQCENQDIECIGDFCYIYCGGTESCKGANIQCQGSCVIYCNGESSCENASINVKNEDSSLYLVRCGAANSCANMVVNAKNTSVDSFICARDDSCSSTNIYCRGNAHCDLSCRTSGACTNMRTQCMGTGTDCSIDISPSGTFDNIELLCDDHATCACGSQCNLTTGIAAIPEPTSDPTMAPIPPTPTSAPSQPPTPAPTLPQPTSAPSAAPSRAPTLPQPTPAPTVSPTSIPTPSPTFRPSKSPTPAPVFSEIFVRVKSFAMSDDARSIDITFNTDLAIQKEYSNLKANSLCHAVVPDLDETQCYYYSTQKQLSIVLSADTTNFNINDTITFIPGEFFNTKVNDNVTHTWVWPAQEISIGPIQAPNNTLIPLPVIQGYPSIGACTDIKLSATNSRNLGYKAPTYLWTSLDDNFNFSNFSHQTVANNESNLIIPYSLLNKNSYKFDLQITNFLNETAHSNFTVDVASTQFLPLVTFSSCPSSWFRSSGSSLILKVKTEFDVTELRECLDQSAADINLREYSNSIDFTHIFDGESTLLLENNNDGKLLVNTTTMSPGEHTIQAAVTVFDNNKESVDTITENCVINIIPQPLVSIVKGGDRLLNLYEATDVVLDGTFSYDPEKQDSSDTDHMQFSWSCAVLNQDNEVDEDNQALCDSLMSGLSTTTDSQLTITTGVLRRDITYQFSLNVSETEFGRSSTATTFITTQFITLEDNAEWVSFSIYSPIDTSSLGVGSKLPLYGPRELKKSEGYLFEWSVFAFDQSPNIQKLDEIVDEDENLVDSLVNSDSIKTQDGKEGVNLIIGPNSLRQATHYLFRLIVKNHDKNEYGVAYSVSYIRYSPIIARFDIFQASTLDYSLNSVMSLNDAITVEVDAIDPNIFHGDGLILGNNVESDNFQFRFFYKAENATKFSTLKFGYDSKIENILFPSGNTTLKICVLDMFDAQTCEIQFFTVQKYTLGNFCELKETFQQIAENSNADQSIVNLIPMIRTELENEFNAIQNSQTSDNNDTCLQEIFNDLTMKYLFSNINRSSIDASTLAMDDLANMLDASTSILRTTDNVNVTGSILSTIDAIMEGYAPHLNSGETNNEVLIDAVEYFVETTFDTVEILTQGATVSGPDDQICTVLQATQAVWKNYLEAAQNGLSDGESFGLGADSTNLNGIVTRFDPSDSSSIASASDQNNVRFPATLADELQGDLSALDSTVFVQNNSLFFNCSYASPDITTATDSDSQDSENSTTVRNPVTDAVVDVTTSYEAGIEGLSDESRIEVDFDYDQVDEEKVRKSRGKKTKAQEHLLDFSCAWYNEKKSRWATEGCSTSLITDDSADNSSTTTNITSSNSTNMTSNRRKRRISCKCNHLTSFSIVNAVFGGAWWEGIETIIGIAGTLIIVMLYALIMSGYLRYHEYTPLLTKVFVAAYSVMNVLSIAYFDYLFVITWLSENNYQISQLFNNVPEFVQRYPDHHFMGLHDTLIDEMARFTTVFWLYSFFIYNWLHVCDRAYDASRDYLKHVRNVIIGINFVVTILSINSATALLLTDAQDAGVYSQFIKTGLLVMLSAVAVLSFGLFFWLRKHLITLKMRHKAGRTGYVPVFLLHRLRVSYRFITLWCLVGMAQQIVSLLNYSLWYQMELYGTFTMQFLNVMCIYFMLHLFKPTNHWLPMCCYATKLSRKSEDDTELAAILPETNLLNDVDMMNRAAKTGAKKSHKEVTRIVVTTSQSNSRPPEAVTGYDELSLSQSPGAVGAQGVGVQLLNQSPNSSLSTDGSEPTTMKQSLLKHQASFKTNALKKKNSKNQVFSAPRNEHSMFRM